MTYLTPALAALSILLGAQALPAQSLQTGLQDLSIPDADTARDRPLQGFLWYPTAQTAPVVQELGNAVWQSLPVIRDAAPVEGKHPLVILSHGMYGNARNQAWLASALVAQGYVVAAIDHPGTSSFDKDPEQSRQLWERPRDVSRSIDYLLASNPLIDPDRIFMAGHSLGGFTAIELAGGRYDPAKTDADCAADPEALICRIFKGWQVGETEADRAAMSADLADPRIKAFAVFDLGGTQTFAPESLHAITRPLLVYGAPLDIQGLDLDVESRALIAALPKDTVEYLEPAELSHFDFLGECTAKGLAILTEEEPEDAFVCENATDARAAKHAKIAAKVAAFFDAQ